MDLQNSDKLITIFGGSGFVGRHVVRNLAKRGYRIRVACRRPDLAGHVVPLGVPGQVVPVQANVRYPVSVAAACDGAYAVINLVGVLFNAGAQSFDGLHVFGAETVAKAAKGAKASMLIHMSSLGASANATSAYARTKAEGESRSKAAFGGAIALQPSVIFGPEDDFLNKFAAMARYSPLLPLVGGDTKFQPVFVGDVAEAIARLIDRGAADGKTYELGGPEQKTFREILDYILSVTYRKRLLLPLPFPVASLVGALAGWLPKPPLTTDQVESLKTDNIVSSQAESEHRTFAALGVVPKSMDSVVPSYLYRYRKAGQFSTPSTEPK